MDCKILILLFVFITKEVHSVILHYGNIVTESRAEYPFMVSLEYNGRHWCGGSIIRLNAVLTAAHCVKCDIKEGLQVRAGTFKREEPEYPGSLIQVRKIRTVVTHERFNLTGQIEYDFALLGLERSFDQTSYVAPIKIASSNSYGIFTHQIGRVLGWGRDENNKSPYNLLYLDLTVLPKNGCGAYNHMSDYATASMICLQGNGKQGSCFGDSGGPFILYMIRQQQPLEKVLFGVTSFGVSQKDINNIPYCVPQFGSIYSDVSFVQPWIDGWLNDDIFKTP